MTDYVLLTRQVVKAPLEQVFAFFADPANLQLITPAWLRFELLDPPTPTMAEGLRLTYRIRPFRIPQIWVSEITVYDPPSRFVDEQRQGPYARWHHEHAFLELGRQTAVLDRVTYALPFGPLGRLVRSLVVRRQLEGIFAYRQTAIQSLFSGITLRNG